MELIHLFNLNSMEEAKNEKCDVCSAMSKCCCAKHKIIHILVWVLVGLAILCTGVSIGAKTRHYKGGSENFGRFENKMGCQNTDCPMMKGVRGENGQGNCMGAVKSVDTTSTTATGTIK